jgi:RNA polymerase sigma factor (TIGR02999 family)
MERAEDLMAVLYETLRGLARRRLGRESRSPTLQPTELVHEAFLRLALHPQFRWESRRYVFGAAAEAMRRILVERARRRRRARHGGHLERVAFRTDLLPARHGDSDFLALNQAIEKLEARDPRKATVVKLRYLIGLTIEETAAVLDLCPATVKQDWFYSRAWLHREMQRDGHGPGPDPPRGDLRRR